MDANRKFDFPPELEKALADLSKWPTTEQGVVPGYSTAFFIITENEKMELMNIVNTLDNLSSEQIDSWSFDEKNYYSALLNSADRVLRNSLSREMDVLQTEGHELGIADR